jgi:hypothetical protein
MMKKLIATTLLLILPCLPLIAKEGKSVSTAEPDIVIRELDDRVVHEYRINGFLYAIKVFPKNGKPYYLVAEDGSDNFTNPNQPDMLIPKWKIFTW